MSSEEVCPFKIMIKWDEHGFYINLNRSSGCGKHKNHAKLNAANIPFSTKLLPKEEKENLIHLANSCAWSGVGRNYIHSKLGKYVSRAKIAWLQDNIPSKLLEPESVLPILILPFHFWNLRIGELVQHWSVKILHHK
jgi:hypothetical protein